MEDQIKIVQEEAEKLLKTIEIDGKVQVEKNEDGYMVSIDTEENALLIGKHGNTLSSLELILSLIVSKKIGEYTRTIIEVGGYRQERENYLKDLAGRLKEEVLDSGYEKTIRGLKPWERRLIHMYLSEDEEVTTESTGDDRERVLVIKKK